MRSRSSGPPPNHEKLIAAAEDALQRRDIAGAVREYERVLMYYPGDVTTMRKLSDLHVRSGDKDGAAGVLIQLARHYTRDGFYLKAIAAWKLVHKLNPARLETYEELAGLYERQGLYVEAVSQLRALAAYRERAFGPDSGRDLHERADALEDAHINPKRRAQRAASPARAPDEAAVTSQTPAASDAKAEQVLEAPQPAADTTPPVPIVRTTNDVVVFLCHASEDKPAVRELYTRLQGDHFQPWLDEEDLLPGQNWQQEIPRAVRRSHVVLVCLSTRSVNKAGYLQREIKFALDVLEEQPEGMIFIVPVRIEECDVPPSLSHLHYADLFSARGYDKLKRALQLRAEQLGFR